MPVDVNDRLTERFARIVAVQEQEAERLLTEAHAEADAMVAEASRKPTASGREARDAAERDRSRTPTRSANGRWRRRTICDPASPNDAER